MKDCYENYTTTSMLANVNEQQLTAYSVQYIKRRILPHLPTARNARILDCGCGYGRYIKALRDAGYTEVTGIDISQEQVAYAREKLGLHGVERVDIFEYLKARSGLYDVILLMDVLEHLGLQDSLSLLELIRDALKPGAVLLLQVPNALTMMNVNRYYDITHQRSYTWHSLAQSLRLAGFPDYVLYPLPPVAHNFGGMLRAVAWQLFLNPMIRLFMVVAHGRQAVGDIFTSNILAVAKASTRMVVKR